jgi:DNA-directed RNA polymerase specialized sigma24 family protein
MAGSPAKSAARSWPPPKASPERQRQVFVLHDLEELSVPDTAAALEITETNVRVQLCSARRALRERLAHLLEG